MSCHSRYPRCILVAGAFVLSGVTSPVASTASDQEPVTRAVSRLDARDLAARARSVAMGGELRVEGVRLPADGPVVALELARFEVVKAEARAIVRAHDGIYELPFPNNVFFKGTISEDPASLAMLVVHETGGVHGFVAHAEGVATLGQQWAPRYDSVDAAVVPIDPERHFPGAEHWQCGSEGLSTPPDLVDLILGSVPALEPPQPTTTKYEVEIVFDTDYEFWALFGNSTDAMNYIATLAAGASAIYDRDINTQWKVKDIYLYTAGAGSDPWSITGGTSCGLFEVGNYWHANRVGVPRDLVHFLSGKPLGGGVAWLGVICRSDFNCTDGPPPTCGGLPTCSPALPDPSWGGGYAFSAGLNGDYTGSLVWDIVVTTHEGGHNFDSPHTHCYADYPNVDDPVIDECFNGEALNPDCWGGAESVPATGGSIMSYCHLQPPGLSNINLYLGRAGFYGTNSDRVQTRTRAEVEANAACLDEIACGVAMDEKTVTGIEPNTAVHGACVELTFENYTVTATGDVTGESPSIVVKDETAVRGKIALVNDVP